MEDTHDLNELTEQLAEARAEIEAMQATVADREAKAAHLEAQLGVAHEELAMAQQGIEARDGELETLRVRSETLEAAVRDSAQRYRALALERSPELPEELVTGETIEDVDHAIERARETVSKVRGHLETQAQSSRVPVGAPARTGIDASALSAQEKIARGIESRFGEP